MPTLPTFEQLGERPPQRAATGIATIATDPLGSAISEVGGDINVVAKQIKKQELQFDTLRAEDAANALREQRVDLTVGQDGYANIKGGDAVSRPLMQEYGQKLQDRTKEIEGALSNPRQRDLFRQRAEIEDIQLKEGILQHTMQQRSAYDSEVMTKTTTGAAMAVQNDPTPRNVQVQMQAIRDTLSNTQWDKAAQDIYAQKALNELHSTVLKQYMATDNPDMAEAYYKINRKEIDDQNGTMQAAIAESMNRKQALGKADANDRRFNGNPALMLDAINNEKDPRKRELLRTYTHQIIDDRNASRKMAEDEQYTTALNYTNEGKEIPAIVYANMDNESRDGIKRLDDKARGRIPDTQDDTAWNEFDHNYADRTKLANMSNKDFWNMLSNFDKPHRERAVELRDAAINSSKGDKKASEFLRQDMSLNQQVKSVAAGLNLLDPQKKPSNYSSDDKLMAKRLEDITNQASVQLEELQIKNKRKATTSEELDVINKLLLPHVKVMVKDRILGVIPWSSNKRLSDVGQDDMSKVAVRPEDVPSEEHDYLKNRAVSLGNKNPDPDLVAKAYATLLTTKGLPNADRAARIDAILRGQ